MTGFVYFIHAKRSNFVKIGFAKTVPNRMRELQVGCPFELAILGWREGDRETEIRIHFHYKKFRIRGEWFEFPSVNDALLAFHSWNESVFLEDFNAETTRQATEQAAATIRLRAILDGVVNSNPQCSGIGD